MKQYHLIFISDEDLGNEFLCIEKAENSEKAVEKALPKAQKYFYESNGKNVELGIQLPITHYDLKKDALTDSEVYHLVQSYPDIPTAETLGKLVVWFNDRDINHICQLFHNNQDLLRELEGYFIVGIETRIDFDKLEQLRQTILS